MRGEGLLTGLRCAIPNGEVAAAFRSERLLSVGAGDNVVRLLPPLIVTEAEIGEAIGMVDRALSRIEREMGLALARGAAE